MNKRITALLLVLTLIIPSVICTKITAREVSVNSALSDAEYDTLLSDMYEAVSIGAIGFVPSINVNKNDIDYTKLYSDFVERYTDCFYLVAFDKIYTIPESGIIASITFKYLCKEDKIPEIKKQVADAVAEYVNAVSPSWTDIQKIIYVHDKLIMESTYDTYGATHPTERREASTSSYGVLIEHTGVCESYSLAFLTIMKELGVDCKRVKSYEIGHVWNVVKCNGKWYHVDLTFDDPSNVLRCNHKYTLLTDSELLKLGDHGTDWEAQTGNATPLDRSAWSSQKNPIYEVNGSFYTCIMATSATKFVGTLKKYNSDLTQTTDVFSAQYLMSAVGKCHTHILGIENILYMCTDERISTTDAIAVDAIDADFINHLSIAGDDTIIVTSTVATNTLIESSNIGQLAKKHDFKYETIRESTCKIAGLQSAICTKCGYSEEQTLPLAHVPQVVQGYPATYTEPGLTDGSVCSVCKAVLVAQEVIPIKHEFDKVITKEPTCINKGEVTYQCKYCTYSYKEDIPISDKHTTQTIKGTPATCAQRGLTDGTVCTVCKKVIVAQKTIAKLSHQPSAESYELKGPNAATAYLQVNYCTVCSTPCNPKIMVVNPFDDVPHGQWYETSVYYCVAYGLFSGMGNNCFCPLNSLTREQFMQVLFNFAGQNKDDWAGPTGFNDVPEGQWYSAAIKWAKESGVTSGVGVGIFGLGVKISREQFATLLMNYSSSCQYDVSKRADLSSYEDLPQVSSWAVTGLQWAVAEGIISGTSTTTLSPKTIANRATAATIFKNYQSKYIADQ